MKPTALFAVLLGGLVCGCSSNVQLTAPSIPAPLVEKIPVAIALRMPADFQQYQHTETVLGRDEYSINLGNSNASLFTQLFQYMFKSVVIIGPDTDPATLGVDALVEPSIDAFEFSTPTQSQTDAFAVWIRYRVKVYDREGALVSNWPVSAYGKSLTSSGSKDKALRNAAVLAMRDAAALMILKFDKVTRIGDLAEKPVAPQSDDPVQAQAHEGQQDETS